VRRQEHLKEIVGNLTTKAALKQRIYDHTVHAFALVKDAMKELADEVTKQLRDPDPRIIPEFRDYGKFAAQLQVAGDTLICWMHTNIFEFNREHKIWELPYLRKAPENSYCGVINVYNFLSDSFKYNRMQDLGYLIARIFINREEHFFVEGKRQTPFHYKHFGKLNVSGEAMRSVLERAILYSMEFDLLVPPYDNVKIISVEQISATMLSSLQQTGKRLGFQFNSDDVLEE